MLERYRMRVGAFGDAVYAETKNTYGLANAISGAGWVRYEDVEPLLKRLAELEAKEQKREQFDRESA